MGSTSQGEQEPVETIGAYRLIDLIGSGGMGRVYRAWDQARERWVALKRLHPERSSDQRRRERLRREALTTAQLDHPAVVPVYDFLRGEECDWLVMEWVEGSTLASLIEERRLTLEQALMIARDVAAGLCEAHRRGIVHCDLKTENVLVTPAGRGRILDFGLARQTCLEDEDESGRGIPGTARAMSPEQVTSSRLDHRSDLFSLGTLLYEAIAGESPFAGRTPIETVARIVHDPHHRLRQLRPEVPEAVSHLVDRLLAKDPAERPASAREVVRVLEEMIGPPCAVALEPGVHPPSGASAGFLLTTLAACELTPAPSGGRSRQRHDQALAELLARHGGELLGERSLAEAGGGWLRFARPIQAVLFALDYHRALDRLGEETARPLSARLGLQLSESGEAPTADRSPPAGHLCALAEPGQTLLTAAVFDLARQGSTSALAEAHRRSWLAHGAYLPAGGRPPLEVFEVGLEGRSPLRAPAARAGLRRAETQPAVTGWRPALGLAVPQHPGWVIARKLADSTLGETWLARCQASGALRVFDFCHRADALADLRREGDRLRILRDHLGDRDDVVCLRGWCLERAPCFLELEPTAGGDLRQWAIAQGGLERVPLEDRLELVASIAAALAACHDQGLLHRDVGPAAVRVTPHVRGRPGVRLAGFDLGRGARARHPDYLAPELRSSGVESVRSDLYALGVLLFQMVVGDLSRPLGASWRHEVGDHRLRRWIAEAVAPEPRRRLSDARLLAERLRSFESSIEEATTDRRRRRSPRSVLRAVWARLRQAPARPSWLERS